MTITSEAPGGYPTATDTAARVEVLDPDYSAEMPGRLAKLEGAISKQRTIKFPYYSISRDRLSERTVNPFASRCGMKRSVASTGMCPSQPPRTTRAWRVKSGTFQLEQESWSRSLGEAGREAGQELTAARDV